MRSSNIEYFGFGSNMNTKHLREWLCRYGVEPESISHPRPAILPGFRFRTNYLTSNSLGAANIEPCTGQQVEGVLLTISAAVLEGLRAKEGYPRRYEEIHVEVIVPPSGRMIQAITFRVTKDFQLPFDLLVSARYRRLILDGAKQARLSEAYQEALKSFLKSPMMHESSLQLTF